MNRLRPSQPNPLGLVDNLKINSDDLECFLHVARHASISRAANAWGIEQSTISRQIAKLEAYCATRLFHRSGRGVALTTAGKELLDHALAVSTTLDEARRAIHSMNELGPASLVIAAQSTIANMSVVQLAKVFGRCIDSTRGAERRYA